MPAHTKKKTKNFLEKWSFYYKNFFDICPFSSFFEEVLKQFPFYLDLVLKKKMVTEFEKILRKNEENDQKKHEEVFFDNMGEQNFTFSFFRKNNLKEQQNDMREKIINPSFFKKNMQNNVINILQQLNIFNSSLEDFSKKIKEHSRTSFFSEWMNGLLKNRLEILKSIKKDITIFQWTLKTLKKKQKIKAIFFNPSQDLLGKEGLYFLRRIKKWFFAEIFHTKNQYYLLIEEEKKMIKKRIQESSSEIIFLKWLEEDLFPFLETLLVWKKENDPFFEKSVVFIQQFLEPDFWSLDEKQEKSLFFTSEKLLNQCTEAVARAFNHISIEENFFYEKEVSFLREKSIHEKKDVKVEDHKTILNKGQEVEKREDGFFVSWQSVNLFLEKNFKCYPLLGEHFFDRLLLEKGFLVSDAKAKVKTFLEFYFLPVFDFLIDATPCAAFNEEKKNMQITFPKAKLTPYNMLSRSYLSFMPCVMPCVFDFKIFVENNQRLMSLNEQGFYEFFLEIFFKGNKLKQLEELLIPYVKHNLRSKFFLDLIFLPQNMVVDVPMHKKIVFFFGWT